MKIWLEDASPGMNLQKVQEPCGLFSLMVEAKLLSPEKLYYLSKMFSSAGRQGLSQQLEGELNILSEQLCTQQYSPHVKPALKILLC